MSDAMTHQGGESMSDVYGTPVVSGMAYAPAVWAVRPSIPDGEAPHVPEEERARELERYEESSAAVSRRLRERSERCTGTSAEVLQMSSVLAVDPGIHKEVAALIADGLPAVQAVIHATAHFVELFENGDATMAERVTDLRDVCARVVADLQGDPEPGVPNPPEPSILLADDLAPADTAGLDATRVIALATELGGPTSHTAIIARQLGIPCVVAARGLSRFRNGDMVLIDGATGMLTRTANPADAHRLVERDAQWRATVRSWKGPAQTTDGHRVELLVNVQDARGAQRAVAGEAEGIGLLRTELGFLAAREEPSVAEQAAHYRPIFQAFSGRKVVIRTLDAGSDKPVAFADMGYEANPALGVRGLRIGLRYPQVLDHQLDAIAMVAKEHDGETWVMAPLVSTLAEAEDFAARVRSRGLKAGIMVEVPSVAVLAEQFLRRVDFVSIGTNDLAQYVMAADRLSAPLAEYTDPWQPAVLALVARIAEAGQRIGTPVGVCGEAAADPFLCCVLVGMGVTSLSMAPTALPAVGAQLCAVSFAQCRLAAESVQGAHDPAHARAAARQALGI